MLRVPIGTVVFLLLFVIIVTNYVKTTLNNDSIEVETFPEYDVVCFSKNISLECEHMYWNGEGTP